MKQRSQSESLHPAPFLRERIDRAGVTGDKTICPECGEYKHPQETVCAYCEGRMDLEDMED